MRALVVSKGKYGDVIKSGNEMMSAIHEIVYLRNSASSKSVNRYTSSHTVRSVEEGTSNLSTYINCSLTVFKREGRPTYIRGTL